MSDTESKSSDLTAECKTTLCMNCAALEAERDRLKEDIEKLIWNLAGCSTFALGYDLDKPFDKTMARAALYDTLACAKDRNRLTQEAERLKRELKRFKKWVSDLQSGLFINCVYCGHQYGPNKNTPITMADVLKAHIEKCPEHPLSKTIQDRDCLTQEVEKLKDMESFYKAELEHRKDEIHEGERWRKKAEKLAEAINGMRHMMYGLSLDLRQAQIAQKAIDIAKEALAEFEREGNK